MKRWALILVFTLIACTHPGLLHAQTLELDYSTYLGGSNNEFGLGISVGSDGKAYVTGYAASTDFPTESPIQGTMDGVSDAFVTKINASGSALVYSTFLGGSGEVPADLGQRTKFVDPVFPTPPELVAFFPTDPCWPRPLPRGRCFHWHRCRKIQ